jgi:hypothetical protein
MTRSFSEHRPFALVLGGGGARGFVHVLRHESISGAGLSTLERLLGSKDLRDGRIEELLEGIPQP